MKKIVCLLLCLCLSFVTFGCSKSDIPATADPNPDATTGKPGCTVTEVPQIQLLSEFLSEFIDDDDAWEKHLSSVSKNVLDIEEYRQELYILTETALHNLSTVGFFQEEITEIDTSNLSCIYDVSDYYIIFIDNDGRYVVYGKHERSGKYVKCEFDVVVTNGLDYPTICKPEDTSEYIINNPELIYHMLGFTDNGIKASVYGFVDIDGELVFQEICSAAEFNVVGVENKRIASFYTSATDKTKGFVLFDNGDLHLADMIFDVRNNTAELRVSDEFISGIERVYSTDENNDYFAMKIGDSDNFYLLSRVFNKDDKTCTVRECKLPIPDNVDFDRLEYFVNSSIYNKFYVKFTDKWMTFKLEGTKIDTNQTVDDFYSKEENKHLGVELDGDIVVRTYCITFEDDEFYSDFCDRIRGRAYIYIGGNDVFLFDDNNLYVTYIHYLLN